MKLCTDKTFPFGRFSDFATLTDIEAAASKGDPIGRFTLTLLGEKIWSEEFIVSVYLNGEEFIVSVYLNGNDLGFLTVTHPALSKSVFLNREHPTMSEIIDRIIETSAADREHLDQQIRALEEKRSAIEHAIGNIDISIAIAAARRKYPGLGEIRLYSSWRDFRIYLIDTDAEDGALNVPLFIRMNDLHEVVEVLLLEPTTYYAWTTIHVGDIQRLIVLLVARAIDALRATGDSESVEKIILGNFKLLPDDWWESGKITSLVLPDGMRISFDPETGLPQALEA